MKLISLNDDFKIAVPDSWEINIDGNTTSLFDPINGVGALQFSSYSVPKIDSINLAKELDDYLEDKYENVHSKYINNYAYFNIIDDDIYWRYWLLKGNDSIMFVSYNCGLIDKDKEDIIIDKAIKSML